MVNGLPFIIDCVVAPRKTFELRLSAELTMLGMIFGSPISDFQNLFFKGCQCKKPSVWAISAVSGFGDMMQSPSFRCTDLLVRKARFSLSISSLWLGPMLDVEV